MHELHESKFPFVSRIEFIRSKLSNFSVHVYGINNRCDEELGVRNSALHARYIFEDVLTQIYHNAPSIFKKPLLIFAKAFEMFPGEERRVYMVSNLPKLAAKLTFSEVEENLINFYERTKLSKCNEAKPYGR